jgi:hypothetical protein
MARFRSWHVSDVDYMKLHYLVIALRRGRFKPGLVACGTIVSRAQFGAVEMIDSGHVRVAIHDQVFNDGRAVAREIISGIHRALPVFPNPFVRALPVADQRFDQIECVVRLRSRRRPALIMLSLGRNENARNKNSCQIISHSVMGTYHEGRKKQETVVTALRRVEALHRYVDLRPKTEGRKGSDWTEIGDR